MHSLANVRDCCRAVSTPQSLLEEESHRVTAGVPRRMKFESLEVSVRVPPLGKPLEKRIPISETADPLLDPRGAAAVALYAPRSQQKDKNGDQQYQ